MEEKNESVSAFVAETVTDEMPLDTAATETEDVLPADFFDEGDGEILEEEGGEPSSESEEETVARESEGDTPEDTAFDGTDHATRAEMDVAVLRARFPEMEGRTLADLPSPRRYGELRELGLSPEEAYLASGARPRVRADNGKAHLSATAPRRAVGRATSMSHAEMRAASELFPGMTGRDILSLYKRVQA